MTNTMQPVRQVRKHFQRSKESTTKILTAHNGNQLVQRISYTLEGEWEDMRVPVLSHVYHQCNWFGWHVEGEWLYRLHPDKRISGGKTAPFVGNQLKLEQYATATGRV